MGTALPRAVPPCPHPTAPPRALAGATNAARPGLLLLPQVLQQRGIAGKVLEQDPTEELEGDLLQRGGISSFLEHRVSCAMDE